MDTSRTCKISNFNFNFVNFVNFEFQSQKQPLLQGSDGKGQPPSSLAIQKPGDTSTNPGEDVDHDDIAEPELTNEEMLLMRGPANPCDLCFYWRRTMLRLAEMEGKEKGQLVENMARKVFPMSFGLFNVVYWLIYLYYI